MLIDHDANNDKNGYTILTKDNSIKSTDYFSRYLFSDIKPAQKIEFNVTERSLDDQKMKFSVSDSNFVNSKLLPYCSDEDSDLILKCIKLNKQLGLYKKLVT